MILLGGIAGICSYICTFFPTAECYGVFAQYRFRCVLGELGRFREGTGFREPGSGNRFRELVPGTIRWVPTGQVLFPRFGRNRFWEPVLGTGFWEPKVLRRMYTFVLWKYTFVLRKYTFVLWKGTFVLWKYTFVLRKYTVVLWKYTFILRKYTFVLWKDLKGHFCTLKGCFCTSKV